MMQWIWSHSTAFRKNLPKETCSTFKNQYPLLSGLPTHTGEDCFFCFIQSCKSHEMNLQGKSGFTHLHVRTRSRSARGGDDSDRTSVCSFRTERSHDLSQGSGFDDDDIFPDNVPPFIRWVKIFSEKLQIPRAQWRAPMPTPLVSRRVV